MPMKMNKKKAEVKKLSVVCVSAVFHPKLETVEHSLPSSHLPSLRPFLPFVLLFLPAESSLFRSALSFSADKTRCVETAGSVGQPLEERHTKEWGQTQKKKVEQEQKEKEQKKEGEEDQNERQGRREKRAELCVFVGCCLFDQHSMNVEWKCCSA